PGRRTMNRMYPFAVVVVIAAMFLCGCEARPSGAGQPGLTSQSAKPSGTGQPGLTTQSANDAERRKEDDEVAAQTRREHPDWPEKQIADYVRGYNGFAISPGTYAKTRAALDAARSLRCQFPRGLYV